MTEKDGRTYCTSCGAVLENGSCACPETTRADERPTEEIPGAARPPDPEKTDEIPTRLPIQMSVHRRSSRVVLNFSNPCTEFSMTSVVARQLADNLTRLAVEIEFRNR